MSTVVSAGAAIPRAGRRKGILTGPTAKLAFALMIVVAIAYRKKIGA
jgi:hypothetical protein